MATTTVSTTSTHPSTPPPSINSENSPTPPQVQQQSPPPPPQTPTFINSITELTNLSTVLSTFHRCYSELQHHLDSIQSSIHFLTQTPPLDSSIEQNIPPNEPPSKTPPPPQEFSNTSISSTIQSPSKTHISKFPNPEPKPKKSYKRPKSELEHLCYRMCHRSVRKYLISHLENTPKLLREVSSAMKFTPYPSRFVLNCLGRFFIMGQKSFKKDSHMFRSREASILILECFLIFGCDGIEAKVKEEAESSAMLWKNRMMTEGGLGEACEIDVRGLLLLVGCFGIPSVFC